MGVIMKRCLALFVALIVIQLNVGALNGQEEIKDANIVDEEVSLHEEPEYVGVAEFDDAYEVDDEDEEHDADENDDDDDENQEDFDDDNDDDEDKQDEFDEDNEEDDDDDNDEDEL